MAITRRQFVTRLGALAAAVGMSQADISKMSEAFGANAGAGLGGTFGKPRVVWLHGAECTGCSTSLLSFLEDANGTAVFGTSVTTLAALGLAGVQSTQAKLGLPTPPTFTLDGALRVGDTFANVADVVIDVVDLQYHETVMGMGGDLAYKWLNDFKGQTGTFVLVVEGALQDKTAGGAWNDASGNGKSWCSIGMSDDGTGEHDMATTVVDLASLSNCAAVVAIGQCASYGGYPGCKPPISNATAGFTATMSQTGAMGVYDYLTLKAPGAAGKVYAVPGCPTNPWWFALTVVILMISLKGNDTLGLTARDANQRLKKVYPITVHSAWCPKYGDYNKGIYALKPGDKGCLQKLGCKGVGTSSLCGVHGWNNQQPQNAGSLASLNGGKGGHCTKAGAPCMGCTEKGYPDSFVPFVKR